MKHFLLSIIFFNSFSLFAQQPKPAIDTSVFGRWPSVAGSMRICNDGSYVLYRVKNDPVSSSSLFIKSLKNSWEIKVLNIDDGKFTMDNRFVIFQRNDSICLLSLASKEMDWIGQIKSYKLCEQNGAEYLIYSIRGKQNLVLRNILSNKEKELLNVKEYIVYNDERTIFLSTLSAENGLIKKSLNKLAIADLRLLPIWSTNDSNTDIRLNTMAWDSHNDQIAFTTHSGKGNAIWYYSSDSNKSILLANDFISGLDNDVMIGDICKPGFSYDGQRLFVTLDARIDSALPAKSVSVDIWNYKDLKPQSQQLYEIQYPKARRYNGVLIIASHNIIRLNYENEIVDLVKGSFDTLACIIRWGGGSPEEIYWNPASKPMTFLISTTTGKRRMIDFSTASASPSGKYVVGKDMLRQLIYIYDVHSGRSYNISNCFPAASRLDEDYSLPGPKKTGLSIVDWVNKDSALIIYDKYDIWVIDPIHQKIATCLTKGYGRRHHIILRLMGKIDLHRPLERRITYVLSAFNEQSKERGFISLRIDDSVSLKLLSMGPYFYDGLSYSGQDSTRVQINDRATFLVRRESANRSPNLFITQDFIKFDPISGVYPEDKYNWLSSEVVSWKLNPKTRLYGILYKPQDFDPKKRYPVLIRYYEQMSDHAYEYKQPGYTGDNINIPWFVSRGYLVFMPDIRYRVGHPGRSACESIVSGTKFLLKFHWVDARRIAVEGHSWGGFETNYLVTHSNLYCAALSASSITDFISDYSSLMKTGNTKQFFYELDQCRIGTTPWKNIELYIENSPVLLADRVQTPILLMNNKQDAIVSFSQGIEFFTALRRLRKKAWLLQYDGEVHSISDKAAVDYSIRMTQFFDHYCKGSPAPKWMTEGIPAKLKGIDSGLDLDETGREP
jgi:hypothetical protein